MSQHRFDRGDTPHIRAARDGKRIVGWPCPFCGEPSLLISLGDLAGDSDRVEVYCDNHMCDAREIVLLNTRGEGAEARADVSALRTVDNGTWAEQEARGAELVRDADDEVIGAFISAGAMANIDFDGSRRVANRLRPTRVRVEPVPPDEEAHTDADEEDEHPR